jgi:hypothetical protein
VFTRTAFGVGVLGGTANVTSIQPVLPIPLGADYLLLRPTSPSFRHPPWPRPRRAPPARGT